MIQRIHIVPVEPMARRLAAHGPLACASADAAFAVLESEYCADDIAAGLDDALARAWQLLDAAASDRPVLLALGFVRDLVSFGALMIGGAYLWAVLP